MLVLGVEVELGLIMKSHFIKSSKKIDCIINLDLVLNTTKFIALETADIEPAALFRQIGAKGITFSEPILNTCNPCLRV